MADIALVAANTVTIVESTVQLTAPAAEAITPGMAVRFDTSTGKFTKAKATDTAEGNVYGIATGKKAILAGLPVTAVRCGVLDGYTFTQDYGDQIYLSDTDGMLADAAGTVTRIVGHIAPAFATTLGTAADKLLMVDVRGEGAGADGGIFYVSHATGLVGESIDTSFFVAPRALEVVSAHWNHRVKENAGTVNIQLTRCQGTEAPASGDALLTNNANAGFDGVATAETVQVGTLVGGATVQLAAGDRLALDFTGDVAGELAGTVITVGLIKI